MLKNTKTSVSNMKNVGMTTASLVQKRPTMTDIKAANLVRLSNSGLLENFVTSNRGLWDNEKWLNLCDEISRQDFTPIDYDQVGLALEKLKAEFGKKQ